MNTFSQPPSTSDYFRNRAFAAAAVMFLIMGVLAARLWQLQLIQGEAYVEMARENRMRVLRLLPSRGQILDVKGQVLADNRPSFTLSIIPAELDNPRELVQACAPVLGITPERIRRLVEKAQSLPRFMACPVKRNLTLEQVSLIKSRTANLKGVVIETRPQRVYPFGESLCHVIGTLGEISAKELPQVAQLGYRPGDVIGKSGLEKEYEPHLKGVEGWEQIEIDAKGRQLAALRRTEPKLGADLILTVDASLQRFIEESFVHRVGSVIALDPDTGHVLAMVSKPGFDLNLFTPTISSREWSELRNDPLNPLENRSIRGLYSPASTFKIVMASAGLSDGAITPADKYVCEGKLEIGGHTYRCVNQSGHGKLGLHRAIVESCDTYFYSLGLKLGGDKIARHALLFGFGKPTGLGLPGELPGLVPNSAWKRRTYGEPWKDGESVTFAIGQGYFVCTPIQLAMMTAAIANGGRLLKPTIVQGIRNPDGSALYSHEPATLWTVPLKPEHLTVLKSAMRGVVTEPGGTGKRAAVPGLRVSGKTGTSQVVRIRDGAVDNEVVPYHERTHAIFVGYVDGGPKKIAVVVVVEHGGQGGLVAAPLARAIIARYYGMPDPGDPVRSGAAP
ncbi:MAG: penicillin-binding protein 2 [Pseudomonadota bacterium]